METVNLCTEAMNRGLIKPERRSGNTTRMVDLAIQLLLEGNKIKIEDHYPSGDMSEYIANKIINRLHLEHNGLLRRDLLSYDKKEKIMYIKKEETYGLCKLCYKPSTLVNHPLCKECQAKTSEPKEGSGQ